MLNGELCLQLSQETFGSCPTGHAQQDKHPGGIKRQVGFFTGPKDQETERNQSNLDPDRLVGHVKPVTLADNSGNVMAILETQRQILQSLGAGGRRREQDGDPYQGAQVGQRRRQQLVHSLGKHRDVLFGRIGQLEDGRTDDEHGNGRSAHNDHQAAKSLFAFLQRRTVVCSHQICENLDASHHRQDTGIATKGEMQVFWLKGTQVEGGQTQPKLPDACDHHSPQQEQHACRRGSKSASSDLWAAINQPAS